MQHGPGPDVVVEEGRRAADLGQAQPQPQEHGPVGEVERHRVARRDAPALQQRPGGLVAQLVRLPVRVALVPEEHHGLVRVRPRPLQEAVHDEVAALGVRLDPPDDLLPLVHVVYILDQVRVAQEEGQQQERGREPDPQQHDDGSEGD